jgi:hypothetical protein
LTRGSNNAGIHGIQIVEELDPQGSVTVTVNRDTGEVVINNTTASVFSMAAYSLTSDDGALDSLNWDSITDNPIDGATWFELSSEPDELAEGSLTSSSVAASSSLSLGNVWSKFFNEDVLFQYLDPATDELANLQLFFEGNGDASFEFLDLDFNNEVNLTDWGIVRDNFNSTFPGQSFAQSYRSGDIDGDGDNDLDDLLAFKDAYDGAFGAGAFAQMTSAVPEPGTAMLGILACTLVGATSLRRRSGAGKAVVGIRAAVAGIALLGISATVQAQSIGINFIAGQNPTAGASVTGTAGVVPQANWNNVSELASSGAAGNLINSAGANSGVSASWTASSTWAADNDADGNEDSNLMDGYIDVTADLPGGRMFIDLADIPYQFYDIYVYVGSDEDGRSARTDINDIPSTETWFLTNSSNGNPDVNVNFTGPESYVQATAATEATAVAANYVIYEDLGFQDVQIGLTRGSNNAGVHGLQIVEDLTPALLTLRVGSNGATSIVNESGMDVAIDYYEIASDLGSLSTAGWSRLEDNPQGLGDGWEELGNLDSNLLGEFYLESSGMLTDMGTPISLGSAVAPGTNSGISFRYHVADGITRFGQVEYFSVGNVDGDYNGDGLVNAADYVLFRNGGPLQNDPTPGVQPADYDYWKARFGNNSGNGSGAGSQVVPEPTALLLMAIAAVLGLCRTRFRAACLPLVACLMIAGFGVWAPTADAAFTADRDYQLGDDETATANQPVGGQTATGDTFDSTGTPMAGDFQDLTPMGTPLPIYVDVTTGGTPRPFTGVSGLESTLGVQFNGSNFLSGSYAAGVGGLGLPSASNPDTQGGVDFSAPNPVADYTGITNRGMQVWVKPTGAAGARQDIINDTYQYGIFISAAGTWGINHGSFPASVNAQSFTSDVPVTFNDWSHVDLHSFGQGLGVLYVDGVAVMTDAGSFASVQGHGTIGENLDISVGANLVGTGNRFTGQVDNIKIYVNGNNTAMNYGTFNVATDNEYLRGLLDGLNVADVNMDGFVNGDGTGSVGSDDISAFIAGYGFQKVLDGNVIPDLESRENGDLNLDGTVNLLDWAVLRANHGSGASLDLGALLNASVPEPSSLCLLFTMGIAALATRRRTSRR